MLYNDGYREIIGDKHPAALGMPGRQCFPEIWDIIGPMLDAVISRGEASLSDEAPIYLERHGYREECYFTFAFSAIRDERGGIGGVFTPVVETSEKVISSRRLHTLQDLARGGRGGRDAKSVCANAATIFAANSADVPFSAAYLFTLDGGNAELVARSGNPPDSIQFPIIVPGSRHVSWETPQTIVLPLVAGQQSVGFLVAGISPHKHLNRSYQTFFELASGQIGAAIAEAQAYEEERRRAEALAELDHAKTQFFTNISHEFRTPLTLMLGPLEDALRNAHGILPLGAARDLQIAHDNARRLLKLVNTLLDFARIEAGRALASFQPTDLVTFTREIISSFESLFEKADLRLIVNCRSAAPEASTREQAFVDRDMWDKIVINLVSNAFKFTLRGEVEVSLDEIDGQARLTVRDTGVGIPSEELPRMFERFHRIKGTRGRSHEGTGIGLALAHELVKLHGGKIDVTSEYGTGSVFTVTIPLGSAHLDPRQITTAAAPAFTKVAQSGVVEEAMRWLSEGVASQRLQAKAEAESSAYEKHARSGKPRIVWADDNSDMRIYVSRLLANRFDVETVCDGQAALDAARAHAPDLVVSDVMMPKLDGLELLRMLRADPELQEIPVILLSARAGEESRIEGLRLGADDYVVKPFSAPELVARIETHIKVSGIRRQAKAIIQESVVRLQTFTDMAPAILWSAETDASRAFFSRGWYDYTGQAEEEALGFGWFSAMHPEDRDECKAIILAATKKQEPFSMDYRLRRADGVYRWVMGSGRPRFNSGGKFQGFIGSIMDIHERKLAELTSSLLSAIVDSSDDAIISKDLEGVIVSWNRGAERLFGYTAEEAIGKSITMLIPHDRLEEEGRILGSIKRGERIEHFETVRLRKGGLPLNISVTISPIKDAAGRIVGASKIARDISGRAHESSQFPS